MGLRDRLDSQEIKVAGKWLFRFILIGLIAGGGAIVFHYLCGLGMHYFLDLMAGYRPDSPAGEHLLLPHTDTPFNRWMLLILPALGGIVPAGWFTPLHRKQKGMAQMLP
jgi:CIC family chloride channel protein